MCHNLGILTRTINCHCVITIWTHTVDLVCVLARSERIIKGSLRLSTDNRSILIFLMLSQKNRCHAALLHTALKLSRWGWRNPSHPLLSPPQLLKKRDVSYASRNPKAPWVLKNLKRDKYYFSFLLRFFSLKSRVSLLREWKQIATFWITLKKEIEK